MNPRQPSQIESTRSHARGFTLIELLVAVVAGLVVAMAAFALSKQSTRFFHEETRLANAQFETLVGFERLRADIARAGYLSTPNIQAEPYHCRIFGDPPEWPAPLTALGAVRITSGPAHDISTENARQPDSIFLTGSYTTDELFPVRAIQNGGAASGDQIFLNVTFGPMQRLFRRSLVAVDLSEVDPDEVDGTIQAAVLQDIFAPGRAIRVLDQAGTVSFGIIESTSMSGGLPRVILSNKTPLPYVSAGNPCGIAGNETGAQVSVINWIRYQLEERGGEVEFPGDDTALQLVRTELDFTSASLDTPVALGAAEVVADFAVDLKFGLTHLATGTSPLNPTLVTLPVGHGSVKDVARDVTTNGVLGPQHIRAIHARLSVRSRRADRVAAIDTAPGDVLRRYQVAPGLFARVRTVAADIQLPNLAEVAW